MTFFATRLPVEFLPQYKQGKSPVDRTGLFLGKQSPASANSPHAGYGIHIFLSYDINKLNRSLFSLGREEKGNSAFMIGPSLSISVCIAFGELYAFSKSWLR